jgi:predicted acyl esterase
MSLRLLGFVIVLMVVPVLSGCVNTPAPAPSGDNEIPSYKGQLVPVDKRKLLPYDTTGEYSFTIDKGVYGVLKILDQYVNVQLPPTSLGGAPAGMARVHMGVWLPNVTEGTKVPVIADVGPYYEDGDVAATTPAARLGGFLITNFVQHGYAVAQVSVLGTGKSSHCMDLMGPDEQAGVDAAVTWLGTQSWSNGNVSLIGRSYDGSTPWQAAMFGNPHLKTIVPISGLIGVHELMWRNGSAENRAPIMHNGVYGTFGLDGDTEDWQNLCKGYLEGPANGVGALVTGDHVAAPYNEYWSSRYFLDRVLKNYKGSVYLIQGLQDWNVDNHMAFPTHQRVEGAGIEIKGLYGQWQHQYPDRPSEHMRNAAGVGKEAFPQSVRFDWAQDLYEWFEYYLKGTGPKPPLHVEVQDHVGSWRIEPTYPPRDATWVPLALGREFKQVAGGTAVTRADAMTFESAPLANATRIAGQPTLHVRVTPQGPGGQLFAHLSDKSTGLRLGHAVMDLRYAAGGMESKPVVPGQPIVAKMQFFAMDAALPAGTVLSLRLTQTGFDYGRVLVPLDLQVDTSGASVFSMPTVMRNETVFFQPPPFTPTP